MPGVLCGEAITCGSSRLYPYTLVQLVNRGKCSTADFAGSTVNQQENGKSGHHNGRASRRVQMP